MPNKPTVSASITAAAAELGIEPPTEEQIARLQGGAVVLPPDSAASAGARGVYDDIDHNTMLRDAGYVELGVDPADPGAEAEVPPPANGNGGEASGTSGQRRRAVCRPGWQRIALHHGELDGRADCLCLSVEDGRHRHPRRWRHAAGHLGRHRPQCNLRRHRRERTRLDHSPAVERRGGSVDDDDISRHDRTNGTPAPWSAYRAA